jgi:c-di-GMP-binding flagellar brake protein YcgR
MTKLKLGARGNIAINAGVYKGHYSSMVEDFKNDMVALSHPLLKGILLPVYRDMDFRFTMEDSAALYMFDMSVRRVEIRDSVPLMWVAVIGEPWRIQRRQFLRISCLWDVAIFHIEAEQKEPMSVTWKPAKASNVSLGGMGLTLDDEKTGRLRFEFGDRLMVRFELFEEEYFLTGRVTKIMHEASAWKVGLCFDSVAISIERKLFRYIRQQEMMGRDV